MSLLQYTITNRSDKPKTFSYTSEGVPATINVDGFRTVTFLGDPFPEPSLVSEGISEEDFVSTISNIPDTGEAWLWNNGDKVQYVKLSNTPLTGSSIVPLVKNSRWIEFSMIGAKDKDGNFLYPNSPSVPKNEQFNILGASNQISYSLLGIDSLDPNSSPAIISDTSISDTSFSYFDSQVGIPFDCNPIGNNIVESRQNEWLSDVDYSVDAITPINFDQILNNIAVKANIPQSNYSQLGFVNSRYVGSSTTRDKINEYNPLGNTDKINVLIYSDDKSDAFLENKGKGPSLGKVPNVELNNAYIAYFNKIIDPYPLLNNKTAYYVKYLIDTGGNILDPSLSDINYNTLKQTFQLKDYDSEPTDVEISISNIDEAKELSKLTDGLSPIFKVGQYPTPILYSQTSSIGHTNEIYMSGSSFQSSLGPGENFTNFGVSIDALQNDAPLPAGRSSPANINLGIIEFTSEDITPIITSGVLIPTSSLVTSNDNKFALFFPVDTNAKSPGLGNSLSDNYSIEGSFTFTTSAIPAHYKGSTSNTFERHIEDYLERKVYSSSSTKPFKIIINRYEKDPLKSDNLLNYYVENMRFRINKVKLTITQNPGLPSQDIKPTIELIQFPKGYSSQWGRDGSTGEIFFQPDSLYIEDLIITQILGRSDIRNKTNRRDAINLIGGGWFRDNSNFSFGVNGISVKYDWEIEFEMPSPIQGAGTYLDINGFLIDQPEKNVNISRPTDMFLYFGITGLATGNLQWRRTFSPIYSGITTTKPTIKYKVSSFNSDQSNIQNTVFGPFWRRVPGTSDELEMQSINLNKTYDQKYVQAKLSYTGSYNVDFPLTVEPDFIEFDPVTDFWALEEGDEIRFENDENLVYTILPSTSQRKSIFTPTESGNGKIRIVVTPPFEPTFDFPNPPTPPTNFDFFVIRRWKENKNIVIVNQQKPYGFPVAPSSSPGIILPEHRVEEFNLNPDLVLKELIEKNII
jgi:hypothetical protein